jgi:hypothetical protein
MASSCTAQSEEESGIDFSKETAKSYRNIQTNKDSTEYYYQQKVAYLNTINLYNVIPKYLDVDDEQVILLVTSEGCLGCTYMPEILDSIAADYPSIKLLEFTPNKLRSKNHFHPERFIGVNKLLADTLLSWGYPRVYYIKNGRVAGFREGGPDQRHIFHHLKAHETNIAQIFGVPNKKKDLVIESKPYEGSIYLDGDIQITFTVEDFNPTKNIIDTCNKGQADPWICQINGRKWYGMDHSLALPSTQLSNLSITLDKVNIPLKTSGMYNVNFRWVSTKPFHLETIGDVQVLSAGFSDGAGYYVAKWEVENGKSKRILLSNNEEDF